MIGEKWTRPATAGPSRARMGACLAVACHALACTGQSQSVTAPRMPPVVPAPDTLVAFVGANVLSMTSPTVARSQTVVVRRGTIVAVGAISQVPVPAGARRIDATGRYLMPGLTDFHVHVGHRTDLLGYVAAGVTAVVHMGGSGQAVRAWRDSVRAGTLVGPDIFAGAFLNGPLNLGGPATVTTDEDARAAVRAAAANGFEFIKVYNSLTAAQFGIVVDEARALGLPLLGHSVRSVGLRRAFELGQRVAVHAEEYIYDELQSQADELIPGAVEFTRRSGVALVPNLSAYDVVGQQWGQPAVVESFLAMPEARYLPDYWIDRWRSADYVRRAGQLGGLPFLTRLTRAMQTGGVPLLLGTDSPTVPGMFPGASIHRDLSSLVDAGLSPYEALVAGTRAPGEVARQLFSAERFGVIAPEYRGDIVMLAANPLDDVRHAASPEGVLTRGRWMTKDELRVLRAIR